MVKIEGKVGLIRFVKVKVDKVGLQIKCLLELNCVCPCSFKLSTCVRRSWVLAGGGRYQIRVPSRASTKGTCSNSCGSGTKKRENLQWGSFL